MADETLNLDRLASGDRPAIYMLGVVGAQSLKAAKVAVFMVDIFGRVRLMPANSIEVLVKPRAYDEELHALEEEQAIQVMIAEGRREDEMLEYLGKRSRTGQEEL